MRRRSSSNREVYAHSTPAGPPDEKSRWDRWLSKSQLDPISCPSFFTSFLFAFSLYTLKKLFSFLWGDFWWIFCLFVKSKREKLARVNSFQLDREFYPFWSRLVGGKFQRKKSVDTDEAFDTFILFDPHEIIYFVCFTLSSVPWSCNGIYSLLFYFIYIFQVFYFFTLFYFAV